MLPHPIHLHLHLWQVLHSWLPIFIQHGGEDLWVCMHQLKFLQQHLGILQSLKYYIIFCYNDFSRAIDRTLSLYPWHLSLPMEGEDGGFTWLQLLNTMSEHTKSIGECLPRSWQRDVRSFPDGLSPSPEHLSPVSRERGSAVGPPSWWRCMPGSHILCVYKHLNLLQ